MLDYDRSRPPRYEPVGHNGSSPQQAAAQRNKSFMDYNIKLCSVFGIAIHVHLMLPAFLALTFLFWARNISEDSSRMGYWIALAVAYNAVLWETVLVHEFGHCLAGWLVGGRSDKIILWPLGGLAYTQPPLGGTASEKRRAQTWIALGGPLTHIPHALMWALLLYYQGMRQSQTADDFNALQQRSTWKEVIYTPIDDWFWYDLYVMGFGMNVWLFALNLLLPAYPLDGSKVFVNLLRTAAGCDVNLTARIYIATNAVLGVLWILFAYTFMDSGSMCQFGGFWAVLQCNSMVQLMIRGQERYHPLLID